MKIRFLGSHNTETNTNGMVCMLLDEQIVLDVGSLVRHLTLQQQLNLKGVLITHQHYDHVRDLPALTMNCFLNNRTVNVYGSQEVQSALEQHLLNDAIYTRFLTNHTLRFTVVQPSTAFNIDDYDVTPIAVNHSVPTQGYLVKKGNRSFFYTGDTGPGLEACWQQVHPDVLITELTSPNRFSNFKSAKVHFTPELLQEELQLFHTLKGYLPEIFVVHMNSALENEIASELEIVSNTLSCKITLAQEGQEIDVQHRTSTHMC